MNVIFWLAAGSIVVWLTVLSMSTGTWQGLQQNLVVGFAGAILGGYLLSPLVAAEANEANFVSVPALVMAALGALSLLNFVKWGTER